MVEFTFVPVVVLTSYAYWLLLTVSIAIWFPNRAKKEWLLLAESAAIQYALILFKWVVPVLLVLLLLYSVLMLRYMSYFLSF